MFCERRVGGWARFCDKGARDVVGEGVRGWEVVARAGRKRNTFRASSFLICPFLRLNISWVENPWSTFVVIWDHDVTFLKI